MKAGWSAEGMGSQHPTSVARFLEKMSAFLHLISCRRAMVKGRTIGCRKYRTWHHPQPCGERRVPAPRLPCEIEGYLTGHYRF